MYVVACVAELGRLCAESIRMESALARCVAVADKQTASQVYSPLAHPPPFSNSWQPQCQSLCVCVCVCVEVRERERET